MVDQREKATLGRGAQQLLADAGERMHHLVVDQVHADRETLRSTGRGVLFSTLLQMRAVFWADNNQNNDFDSILTQETM